MANRRLTNGSRCLTWILSIFYCSKYHCSATWTTLWLDTTEGNPSIWRSQGLKVKDSRNTHWLMFHRWSKCPLPPPKKPKKKTVIVATWSCTTRDNRIQNMPFEGLETLFFFFKERRWNTCVWTFRLLCNSLTLSAKATWTMLDQIPSLHWHHSVTTKKKQTACV